MKARILTFVCMAVIGAVASRITCGNVTEPNTRPVTEREAKPKHSLPRPVPTSANLIELSRDAMEKMLTPGFSPYSGEFDEWTTDEIRAALNEALANKEFLLESGGASSLASALVSEWMKRDCDGAIHWYLTKPSPAIRARMALSLSRNWPRDHPEKGLEFLKAHRDLLPGSQGWSIVVMNIESRAESGPNAMGSLLAELREAGIGLDFGNPVRFPANFDFTNLMAQPEMQTLKEKGLFIQGWKTRDREEAFNWLLKNEGASGLTALASSPEGINKEDLEWLGGKYQNLEPGQRSEFLSELENHWINHPDNASAFVTKISDPQIADEVREFGVQLIFAGRIHDGIPFLSGISDPAKRISILENAHPLGAMANHPDMRHFTPAVEAALRKTLSDWKATDQQTETIISRFKP